MLKSIAATGVDPYALRYEMADLFHTGFQGRVGVKFTVLTGAKGALWDAAPHARFRYNGDK